MTKKPFPTGYVLYIRDPDTGKSDVISLNNMFSVQALNNVMGQGQVFDLGAANIKSKFPDMNKILISKISSLINTRNERIFEIEGSFINPESSLDDHQVVVNVDSELKNIPTVTHYNRAKIVSVHVTKDMSLTLYDDQGNVYYDVYLEQIGPNSKFDGSQPIMFKYRERDDTEDEPEEVED